MLKSILPGQAGIKTENVCRFLSSLVKRRLNLHSMLLMRGEDIFLETYWEPFNKDTPHRMYSVTKSFVSVAIGLAEEDGLIDLDRPVSEYFPEKLEGELCEELKKQTVREMLTMTTVGPSRAWFKAGDTDRTHLYFSGRGECRPAGTVWQYDSPGSQVLCDLVERVTGRPLFDYLNERIFVHLGAFKNAKILKTPNGVSWGDSAMICTPRDLALFARFVMNYGVYDGKRLMNEAYLKKATSKIVDNRCSGHRGLLDHGYGYQFWRTEGNGFAFVGMGNQLAVCFPDRNVIMVCTGDMQGNAFATDYIVAQLVDNIIDNMEDLPIHSPEETDRELLPGSLRLLSVEGDMDDSPYREKINGTKYKCRDNSLGWLDFFFEFEDCNGGRLVYRKESGVKELPFYVNKNRFGTFPEDGYSKDVGGVRTTDGHRYKDAVSFAWLQENKIMLFIQIIDEYLGNATVIFSFKGDKAVVTSVKNAEDFLWDYSGEAVAEAAK